MTPERYRCPLCGASFTHLEGCPSSCPLARGCNLVRCPRCGYEYAERSRLLDALGRVWRRLRRDPARAAASSALTVASLGQGETAQVSRVGAEPAARRGRLADLGVVPGATLRLLQRRPAFVIQLGETTLALERAVAEVIEVVTDRSI